MPIYRRGAVVLAPILCLLLAAASPAAARAWTRSFETTIAREGARFAPPDLHRQIARRDAAFRRGVQEGAGRGANETAGVALERETERAVAMIRALAPFDQVVYQLGVVSRLVAQAHDPLPTSDADRREGQYASDYASYAESASNRFPLVFYGFRPRFGSPQDVRSLAQEAGTRGRDAYDSISREYARIGYARGIDRFDDRSTAFGVSSLAFSHAASDVGEVLRYIWLRAGGRDTRSSLPARGGRLLRIPRLPRTSR